VIAAEVCPNHTHNQILDDRIAEPSTEDDDLAGAKAVVDEALAEVDRGEFLTREEHGARVAALLASFKVRR
jgi:antitoxin ParD1/3/4